MGRVELMAILPDVAEKIAALPLREGFSVCELGDQGMAGEATRRLAKEWYAELGCSRYVSIDGNGNGTLTADLNRPIALEPFDLVTDFGTGEHIFDQAQVWRTIHALTKVGGFIAFDRPSQGYEKHCFYLTNECLFRDIAKANGYELVWLDRVTRERGQLIRGIYRRTTAAKFCVPQQGKYHPSLVIPR